MKDGGDLQEITNDFYVFRDFDETLLREVGQDLMFTALNLGGRQPVINLWINSYGGLVSVLNTVLDAVEIAKARGVTVATYATGAAYSCGSMLAVAGTPGHRYMGPNAHHLLHFGWTGAEGTNPVEFDRDASRSRAHFDFVFNHYRKHAKVPRLREKLKDDNLFVGFDQAVEWKLADGGLV